MTKDEFLCDPVAVYLGGRLDDVPPEWVQEAWDAEEDDPDRSLRKYVTGDVWHETNKGCLPMIVGQLQWLGRVLRCDQWDDLYRDIREEEPHRESEIRQEFVSAAPEKMGYLPPPLTQQEVVDLLGSEETARMLGVFDDTPAEERGNTS